MSTQQTIPTDRRSRIEPDVTRRHRRVCKEKEDMEKFEPTKQLASRRGRHVLRFVALAIAVLWTLPSPALAQFTSGSSGIHGFFPPPPPQGSDVTNYTVLVWNVTTGGVRYCSVYTATGSGVEVCDPGSTINVFVQIPNIPAGGLTSGVYEFSDVEMPAGNGFTRQLVVVGATPNTPLVILSQADIEFPGSTQAFTQIRVNGWNGQTVGTAPNLAVVGGRGGPGGFNGGMSSNGGSTAGDGSAGFGPTGGAGGDAQATSVAALYGGPAQPSPVNPSLTPLTGGAGGGGGSGVPGSHVVAGTNCGANPVGFAGGGGGGGGGALLLAATGRVLLGPAAQILIQGGNGGYNQASGCGLSGGGGAGGSVRIVANEFLGNGTIDLSGGTDAFGGNRAAGGQVRVEANINTFNGNITGSSGTSSFLSFPTAPIPLNQPVLRITSIGGSAAPTIPTAALGAPDITFANAVEGPVTVEVAASNVPIGTTVNIRVVPATGAPTSAVTSGLTGGSVANTTAQATNVILPPGAGVVTATATFNVGGGMALNLPLIDGERPTQVEVVALADGSSRAYFVTPSGRRREMTSALQ